MTELLKNLSRFQQKVLVLLGIIVSGLCWYLSCGLSGNYWYLLWIAPIPILVISWMSNGKQAFLFAFIAYLIGRLSWFTYLVTVATLIPAILFTVALPFLFAAIILLTRYIVHKTDSWLSVFIFPVLFTTFEYLLFRFSPDGTAASLAYSQSNVLPVIQIASLTGILGITFLVTFIPSAIASALYVRNQRTTKTIVGFSIGLLVAILIFGIVRLQPPLKQYTMKVGLVVLEEKMHDPSANPDSEKEKLLAESYSREISKLAAQGAALIVLPERAINIQKESAQDIIRQLTNTAKQQQVFLVIGYTNYRNEKEQNAAMVLSNEGTIVTDYTKVHLVTGLEKQFTPGSEIGLFRMPVAHAGIAICKDLDFDAYIKKYGTQSVGLLTVPAWDFITDDWLHSRMAILRGVENGFSEIRTARLGRLTISDACGRVSYEASCSNGSKTTLIGTTYTDHRNTLFSRFGNWFGICNAIAAIGFIAVTHFKKK